MARPGTSTVPIVSFPVAVAVAVYFTMKDVTKLRALSGKINRC